MEATVLLGVVAGVLDLLLGVCRCVQPKKMGLPLGENPHVRGLTGRKGSPWNVGLGLGACRPRATCADVDGRDKRLAAELWGTCEEEFRIW